MDGLEAQFKGKVSVRRIDANSEAELSKKMNIQFVPTYVFLDTAGAVIERQESGDPQALLNAFEKAAGQ